MYNFKLDTSNLEKLEKDHGFRQQSIKRAWIAITTFFLEKGTNARFKYWPDDVTDVNTTGYSGYGIKELIILDPDHIKGKAEDNLILLTVVLNDGIKDFIYKSMQEDHIMNSTFFHFDILDETDASIYTSHDFGENVLMYLTESGFEKLSSQHIAESDLISLPETIEVINQEHEL
ncbi:hypothetical protein JSQ81_11535 [Sporosarcina sp. Marseille-Q4063]|uniref:hypothetical protein n=1 Tax=Sporosarcina sp. Marseille-Q4063 TaxID=2810514 RepID=UPI001BAEAFC3|nr:hypothetical protein [Sporosarcina sp. Marseille-Q4063]QUW20493.1 hypothetical protein JSQ81_11535 [Sporosarcina sp. Marseille-Q4063]